MERFIDEELSELNRELVVMADAVEEAIQRSIEALQRQDAALARRVIEQDKRIDEMEVAIENKAIGILACQQPMARDLRFVVTTGIKLNAELERIADLAVNIAQRVSDLSDKPLLKPLIDIPRLSEIAKKMVREAIQAYVSGDEKLARTVILTDPQADTLRNNVQEELINDFIIKDGAVAPRAVPLLLIARHLERICDHATNIAEDVIYMVQARVVKHHPENLDKNGE